MAGEIHPGPIHPFNQIPRLGIGKPVDKKAGGNGADIGNEGQLLRGSGHETVQVRVVGRQDFGGLLSHLADAEGAQEPCKARTLAGINGSDQIFSGFFAHPVERCNGLGLQIVEIGGVFDEVCLQQRQRIQAASCGIVFAKRAYARLAKFARKVCGALGVYHVAAALDMLFDGPGGWPIEPGWWTRTPDEFGDQLQWCELCGFALDTFTRDSSEELDDISPEWYERLKELRSPKLTVGKVNILKIENGVIVEENRRENKLFSAKMPYAEHYEDRFNAKNSVLFIHDYQEAVVYEGKPFGELLRKTLAKTKEWIVLRTPNSVLASDFNDQIGRYVLNPGTLHYIDLSVSSDTKFVANADTESSGYVALFSKHSLSLRKMDYARISKLSDIKEFLKIWSNKKIVELSSEFDRDDLKGKLSGQKFIVWGAGSAGENVINLLRRSDGQIVMLVDKDEKKCGKICKGIEIKHISNIQCCMEYNRLIIANYRHFYDIRKEAIEMGVSADKIWFVSNLNDILYGE